MRIHSIPIASSTGADIPQALMSAEGASRAMRNGADLSLGQLAVGFVQVSSGRPGASGTMA